MIALQKRNVISNQKLLNMSPVYQLSVSVIETLMNSVGWKCKSVNLKFLLNYSGCLHQMESDLVQKAVEDVQERILTEVIPLALWTAGIRVIWTDLKVLCVLQEQNSPDCIIF